MECDHRHSAALLQRGESVRQRRFQHVKLVVHFYPYRLEAFPAGILLPAVCRRHARLDYLRKLPGGFNRGGQPVVLYASCYTVPEFLLAVVKQYPGDLFLAVFVHNVPGGKSLAAHSHIQRRVIVEGKSAFRRIKLVR